MQAQPYVVGYYPLPVVFPARMLPEEDIAEFVKVPESVEIGKSADMAPVIPENLVEKQIAVLEAPGVYGNQQASLLETLVIGAYKAFGFGDAGNNHIRPIHKRFCPVYDFELQIAVRMAISSPLLLS